MMRNALRAAAAVFFLSGLAPSALAAHRGADFNGDGFDDLVIPMPDADYGYVQARDDFGSKGAVKVIYGSHGGLQIASDQLWTQDSPGIDNVRDFGDFFGSKVAWGDFNGDGFDDLAISAPGEALNGHDFAGAVHIIYGSVEGLTADGCQFWTHDSPGISGEPTPNGRFGAGFGVGDFNGDGLDDLAIGEANGSEPTLPHNAGALHILFGTASGLSAAAEQVWHQDIEGVAGAATENNCWGNQPLWGTGTLAAADFNGDGFDDLAVPGCNNDSGVAACGSVSILYGSPAGLATQGTQLFGQATVGINSFPHENDCFGAVLATGDFDHDGFADLAISSSGEHRTGMYSEGSVHVLYGSQSGLSATRAHLWHQDKPHIYGTRKSGDRFGDSLAVGDFDRDGFDDLAIGIPGDRSESGGAFVIRGSSIGLTRNGISYWSQDTSGIPGRSQHDDWFAEMMASGDYNGDGFDDWAIEVSGNLFGGHILYGSRRGIRALGSHVWHRN